jgi:hypothetical protein
MQANHLFTKKGFASVLMIFFGTCICIHSIAQRISIVSKNTGEPLPYATITNINAKWSNVSKADGSFIFTKENSNTTDTLIISYTGYETITLTLPKSDKEIALQPVAAMLMPVEVFPCKSGKTTRTENYTKYKADYSLGSSEKALASWAAHIQNQEKSRSIVTQIQFYTSQYSGNKTSKKAPFKIRILSYDTLTKLPGNPLLYQEIIVYPNGNKVTLDLNDYSIRFPKEGLVVAIDYFYAGDEYVFRVPTKLHKPDGSVKDTVMMHYGASIRAAYDTNLNANGYIYNYYKKTWTVMRRGKNGTTTLAPMVKLTLKTCD